MSACDYCGLPLPGAAHDADAAPGYCCFGCRFAAEVTRSRGEEGAANGALIRLGAAIFLSMNVMAFTMALWSGDVYAEADAGPFATVLHGLFRYLCLLFALPVLFLLGGPILGNAWDNLRRGSLHADLLLITGVVASYLYSAYSVWTDGPIYFEVGCAVLVLVTLGRWLEATGRLRTAAALDALRRLLPERARVVRDIDTEVPLDEVRVGDRLRVAANERVPCDGRLLRQSATFDEQALTGESRPAVKEPGDVVFGGSLCLEGDALVEVTADARSGTLARLIDLVREARRTKGRFERLADRVTGWFLPLVVAVALVAGVWHGVGRGPQEGILTGLAVLLIACPCALGLATPLAVWAGLTAAARRGVLFRHGEALERLATVRAVRLDKTGTLTTGAPTVAALHVAPGEDRDDVLRDAARLALASNHGFAHAVRRFAAPFVPVGNELPCVRNLPGRGVATVDGGITTYLGSRRLMGEQTLSWSPELADAAESAEREGRSLSCLASGGTVRGLFVFREETRPGTAEALVKLQTLGLDVAVLTGDGPARGRAFAAEIGLPVMAGLLPEEKVAQLAEARRLHGPVAMVGDGINDAPALAASDVGIALGCGTDVARDAAAVCLIGDDLRLLPWAVDLARRTVGVIRRNLFWAFAYNVVGVGLACTGRLNPVVAALAMVLSSLFVLTGSLRLVGLGEAEDEGAPVRRSPEDAAPSLTRLAGPE